MEQEVGAGVMIYPINFIFGATYFETLNIALWVPFQS